MLSGIVTQTSSSWRKILLTLPSLKLLAYLLHGDNMQEELLINNDT